MRLSSPILLCILTAGCPTDPAPSGDAPPTTSTGFAASSSSDGESTTGPSPLEPLDLDRAWIETLAGPWRGPVRATPIGDLPDFFWEFAWTEDDAMVAIADNGMGFRFEFAFAEVEGQWVLEETGSLPGGMTQSYVLHPVAREGARVRFEVLERPGYLQLDIEPTPTDFGMVVSLRGEPHGTFDLARPD